MDHSSFFSCFWFVETGRCLRLRDEATVYDEIYGRGVSTVSSLDSSLLEVEEFYTVVEFHRSANEAIKWHDFHHWFVEEDVGNITFDLDDQIIFKTYSILEGQFNLQD